MPPLSHLPPHELIFPLERSPCLTGSAASPDAHLDAYLDAYLDASASQVRLHDALLRCVLHELDAISDEALLQALHVDSTLHTGNSATASSGARATNEQAAVAKQMADGATADASAAAVHEGVSRPLSLAELLARRVEAPNEVRGRAGSIAEKGVAKNSAAAGLCEGSSSGKGSERRGGSSARSATRSHSSAPFAEAIRLLGELEQHSSPRAKACT